MYKVQMLRMAIQDFVDNMQSESTNFSTSLARSICEMKKVTEQIQQYVELYEELPLKTHHFKDFFSVIKANTQMDVTGKSIQFRTKWKA